MLIYFLLLLIPGLAGLLTRRPGRGIGFALFLVLLAVVVGLRQKVGMDWNNYLALHVKSTFMSLGETLASAEPGYGALMWFSERLGFGVYGANFVAAAVFATGLFMYARTTANPWMALVGAIPYLVVVIGMSATRQSMAIGVMLMLCSRWSNSSLFQKLSFIVIAAMFHMSAILGLGLLVLESRYGLITKTLLVGLLAVAAISSGAVSEHLSYYSELYISNDEGVIQSAGALYHVALVAVPGMAFLFMYKEWQRRIGEDRLLYWMAVISVVALPAAFIWSTAVDRMSLYFYPLALAIYGNAPYLLSGTMRRVITQSVMVIANFLILLVWLNYANSALAYVPYRSLLS